MGIVDWVFPKICVGCGKWGRYVCEKCEIGLVEEEQICPGCGRNSRYGQKHKECGKKSKLEGLTCFWQYEGLVKKLISEAKYQYYYDQLRDNVDIINELVKREEFAMLRSFLKPMSIIVPVPLFKNRLKERGFNQAEIIAKEWGKVWQIKVENNLIKRVKDTGHQVGRSREERLEAVKGAFEVVGLRTKIENVVLVDDVWTTGATMNECAEELHRTGAKKIWGLVLAR